MIGNYCPLKKAGGELKALTVGEVVQAVLTDPGAAYCRQMPARVLTWPRELYLPTRGVWVEISGRHVSAALRGYLLPGLLGRLRIRRAVRQRVRSGLPIEGVL